MTGSIETAVRKYLSDRPGQEVYLSDIETDLSLTHQTAQSAAYRLERRDAAIVKVMNGVYSYRPAGRVGTRMFEELAVTKNGRILIQDEDGTVYVAEVLT